MNYDSLVPSGSLKLIVGPHFMQPESEISISPRLLNHAVEQSAGAFVRIYRPKPTMAFSTRDRADPSFSHLLAISKEHGFAPVTRSPGGRVVAYHEESVVVDFLSSENSPHAFIKERFEALGAIFVEVLALLGITAKVGEIPREYCPGKYSVTSNSVKLVGSAQRLVRGGWLLSSSIIVRNGLPVRNVLSDIYSAMDYDMDPRTIVALNEFESSIESEDFISLFTDLLRGKFDIIDCELRTTSTIETRESVAG